MARAKTGGVYPYIRNGKRAGWRVVHYNMQGKKVESKIPKISKTEATQIYMQRSALARMEMEGCKKPAARINLDEANRERWRFEGAACSDSTRAHQEGIYNNHIKAYLGRKMISALDYMTVQDWVTKLATGRRSVKKRSPSTIEQAYKLLVTIVRAAAQRGAFGHAYIGRKVRVFDCPWGMVKRPEVIKRRRPALAGPDDVSRLFQAAYDVGGTRAVTAMTMATFTGSRRAELPHMKWGDEIVFCDEGDQPIEPLELPGGWTPEERPAGPSAVDSWADVMDVAKILGLDRAHAVRVRAKAEDTKNRDFRGTFIYAPNTVNIIVYHYVDQRIWAHAKGIAAPAHLFVARSDRVRRGKVHIVAGQPVQKALYWYQWRDIRAKAGLQKHFRFHDLRGTFCKRLQSTGSGLPIAQELMGHADHKTTMGYSYEEESPLARQATRVLGEYLDPSAIEIAPRMPKPGPAKVVDRPTIDIVARDIRRAYGVRLKLARGTQSQASVAAHLVEVVGVWKAASWKQRLSRMERADLHALKWFQPSAEMGERIAEALRSIGIMVAAPPQPKTVGQLAIVDVKASAQ